MYKVYSGGVGRVSVLWLDMVVVVQEREVEAGRPAGRQARRKGSPASRKATDHTQITLNAHLKITIL